MEKEMQTKLDQARAKFHAAVNSGDQTAQDSTWAVVFRRECHE